MNIDDKLLHDALDEMGEEYRRSRRRDRLLAWLVGLSVVAVALVTLWFLLGMMG